MWRLGPALFDPALLFFLQKKVNFLQSYVNDLEDQNQVLVQTIEDLQEEADHKLSNVVRELHTSDGTEDVRLCKCSAT